MFMAAEMDAGDMIATGRLLLTPMKMPRAFWIGWRCWGADLLAETGNVWSRDPWRPRPRIRPRSPCAYAHQGHVPHRLDQEPPGDLESHPGPGSLACGHHGVGGGNGSGSMRRRHCQRPRSAHWNAPGRDEDRLGDGLQARGVLEIRVLQADGGKRMAAPDYLRGHPLPL